MSRVLLHAEMTPRSPYWLAALEGFEPVCVDFEPVYSHHSIQPALPTRLHAPRGRRRHQRRIGYGAARADSRKRKSKIRVLRPKSAVGHSIAGGPVGR